MVAANKEKKEQRSFAVIAKEEECHSVSATKKKKKEEVRCTTAVSKEEECHSVATVAAAKEEECGSSATKEERQEKHCRKLSCQGSMPIRRCRSLAKEEVVEKVLATRLAVAGCIMFEIWKAVGELSSTTSMGIEENDVVLVQDCMMMTCQLKALLLLGEAQPKTPALKCEHS